MKAFMLILRHISESNTKLVFQNNYTHWSLFFTLKKQKTETTSYTWHTYNIHVIVQAIMCAVKAYKLQVKHEQENNRIQS